MTVILDAPTMEQYDRCRRLGVWLQEWSPIRVTPLSAVYRALKLVLETDEYRGPQMARDYVMELAANRGVHTMRDDPYDQMQSASFMAEAIARVLRQPSQKDGLRPHPQVRIAPERRESALAHGLEWQPTSYLTDGGTRLMRVVLVDHWDDDRQMSELHGWRTIGDVCTCELPMTIRVIVIGQSRAGRRHGHWTRARQHPINKQIRFQRKHSREDGFSGSWVTVYRENTRIGVDAWVEQMARDGVLTESAFNQKVIVPSASHRDRVREDILATGRELQAALDQGTQFPMNRSACDSVLQGPCRFQCACLGEVELEPGETGMFERRKGETYDRPKKTAT